MNVYIFLSRTIVMFLLLDRVFCSKHGAKRQRAQFKSKEGESYRARHKMSKTPGDEEFFDRRARSNFDNKKQCAVMYKNKEPIGVLEPFDESYRLLPISGEKIPVDITPMQDKRRNLMDLLYPSKLSEDAEDTSKLRQDRSSVSRYSDEKYPYIFAKFKIENRLNREFGHKRSMHKRSSMPLISDQNVDALKATLAKMNTDNSESVDRELRSILNNMGLIENDETRKEEEKRAVEEDENMELGSNKISMAKEQPKPEKRQKRQDSNDTVVKLEDGNSTAGPIALFNEDSTMQSIDLLEGGNQEIDEHSEEKSRGKRETGSSNSNESSGAFTTQNSFNDDSDLTDYEKRVVRDIRQKIAKLKEEVKKEIEEIKTGGEPHFQEIKVEEPQRKKRETKNTLLDEETAEIDPLLNVEEDLKPHVRRRRSLEDVKFSEELDHKRELSNVSNTAFFGRRLMEATDEPQINDEYNRTKHFSYRFLRSERRRRGNNTTKNTRKLRNNKNKKQKNEASVNIKKTKIPFGKVKDSNGIIRAFNTTKFVEPNLPKNKNQKSPLNAIKRDADENDLNATATSVGNTKRELIPKHKIQKRDLQMDYGEQLVELEPQHSWNCQDVDHHGSCELKFDVQKEKEGDAAAPVRIDRTVVISKLDALATTEDRLPHAHRLRKRDVQYDYDQDENDDQESDEQFEDDARPARSADDDAENSDADDADAFAKKHPCNCQKNSNGCKCGAAERDDDDDYDSKVDKREAGRFENGEYYLDLHPDVYEIAPARQKRQSFEDLVAAHGGATARGRLVAVRQRTRFRRRAKERDVEQPQQLTDMSDEDLFGALPQSFEGELARYKRVKRQR